MRLFALLNRQSWLKDQTLKLIKNELLRTFVHSPSKSARLEKELEKDAVCH